MTRKRLGEFNLVADVAHVMPAMVAQVAFGVLCFAAAFLTREVVDMFTPGAGPFSLIFPAVMISTLYGKWLSGVVTFSLAFLHAWYFVLPFEQSFAFENPADQARTVVNGVAALVILFFAEVFRSAVRQVTTERDAELKTQELLMLELEHRTKNNFAMVSSLLSIQLRKSASDDVKQALSTAAARVQSFAAIHETIYTSDKYAAEISLKSYLTPLIQQLQRGLFQDRPVQIKLDCSPGLIQRQRALAFGLIVNELVTNAAKHAFPDNRNGMITVSYIEQVNAPWRLSVSDDGCGSQNLEPEKRLGGSGLGSSLLTSFVVMANGELVEEDVAVGTCITIREASDH